MISESNSDDGRTTATSESTEAAAEEGDESPVSFGERLTSFQSLIFVKAFREEKVSGQKLMSKVFCSLYAFKPNFVLP